MLAANMLEKLTYWQQKKRHDGVKWRFVPFLFSGYVSFSNMIPVGFSAESVSLRILPAQVRASAVRSELRS